jgi:hypothetical protein
MWILQPFYFFYRVITDTLMVNGKFAHKRVLSFSCFIFGTLYAFIPYLKPNFEVKEFVVMCFFGLSAGCLGIDLQQQIKLKNNSTIDNIDAENITT